MDNAKIATFKTILGTLVICASLEVYAKNSIMILIGGEVEESVSLSVLTKGDSANLNLHTDQFDKTVATIFESANTEKGYLVKARSENNGVIKNTNGVDGIPYTLRYGEGNPINLNQEDQLLRDSVVSGVYQSSGKDIKINYKGVPATKLKAGIYKDIITLTIEGK